MPSELSHAFSRWIEKVIADPHAKECLPATTELSRRFKLSRMTINRLLKPYIAEGVLTAIRGKGTFITSRMFSDESAPATKSITSARSIFDAVADDIATGRLKHGDPLPPSKLLRAQFKTGNVTIRQAYRMLEKKGLARRIGRSYWVGGLQSLRSFGAGGTIVCFNFSEGDPTDLTQDSDIRAAFSAMEHELHNHRLRLRFEDCAKLDVFLRPEAFGKGAFSGACISGITKKRFAELAGPLEALGPVLSRSGKRILLCGAHYKKPRKAAFFCHGTVITSVVRTAADYCSSKGFSSIVLLFRETDTNITDLRFLVRFISESLMRNPEARIMFLIQPLHRATSPEEVFQRTVSYRMHRHFEYYEGLLSKYTPLTMDDLYGMISLGDSLEELCSRVPAGSVWLCRDAATAREAVAWCQSNRIPIPAKAAVLCVDDDPSLALRGIATCVPDWSTMGYLMAHALIGDMPVKTSRQGFLRTPAVLYERETVP